MYIRLPCSEQPSCMAFHRPNTIRIYKSHKSYADSQKLSPPLNGTLDICLHTYFLQPILQALLWFYLDICDFLSIETRNVNIEWKSTYHMLAYQIVILMINE